MLSNSAFVILLMLSIAGLREYLGREFMWLVGLAVVGGLVAIQTKDYSLLKLVVFMAAAKGVDFRRCIRVDAVVRSTVLVLAVTLSRWGTIEDFVFYSASGEVRHSMGFTHPNQLGMVCVILCLEILYLASFRLSVVRALVIVALLAIVDRWAVSRSAELVMALGLSLAVFNVLFSGALRSRFFVRIAQVGPFVMAGLTVGGVWLYRGGSHFGRALDELLSYRLSYIVYHFDLMNVRMFGNDISVNSRTLDSWYAYVLLAQGLVVTVLYFVATPRLMRSMSDRGDWPLLAVFLCLFVYGASERLWMSVDFDVLVLAYSYLLYRGAGVGSDDPDSDSHPDAGTAVHNPRLTPDSGH